MQITETQFWGDTVVLTIGTENDLTLGDTGPGMTIRMPAVGDEKSSLAFHRLATLKQARDVIGAEIQRLSQIVDQDS
jgi:hypothetical protein